MDFIPKWAPWYGGFWEQIIGLKKQAVKKTLGIHHPEPAGDYCC